MRPVVVTPTGPTERIRPVGKTHKSTWKQREREAASLFGSKRQRCSGSSGRGDCSRSDSTHATLFIETKLRASHAAVALFEATRILARREGKIPVIALAQKGRPGVLLVIDPADLAAVAREYAEANAIPADCPTPPMPPQPGRSAGPEDLSLATIGGV